MTKLIKEMTDAELVDQIQGYAASAGRSNEKGEMQAVRQSLSRLKSLVNEYLKRGVS